MTKVILHGKLGKKYGREFDLHVASPADAIRAFVAMIPEFYDDFKDGDYYVYLGNAKNKTYLDEEKIRLNTDDTINIVPAVAGGKSKGAGKILAGIALIGISFIPNLNVAAFGALQGLAGGAVSGATLKGVAVLASKAAFLGGLTLALGGAAQMTAPKVSQPKESNLFSGTPDSITEGPPVPLVYGEYLAIGYPVSFEITNGINSYSGSNGPVGGGPIGGGSGGWDSVNRLDVL